MQSNRIHHPLRWGQQIPWTLAATLAIVFLTATILVGLSLWPSISQSSLAASTTTPVPAADKVLPIAVGGYVSDFSDATLQQMRDAGMTWIGAELPYYSVANGSANALQTLAQSLITNAHDRGFRIMLRISGSPSDMIGKSDNYNKEFAQFVAYVATLKADAIQIWDSQNLDLFWRVDQIDPAAYIELLRESYAAIKAANADTKVIIGAPAPTSAQSAFPGRMMNDDLYYQGMAEAYTALGEPAADCIGVTYIEGAVAPDQTSGDTRDNYPTRYFSTMLRRAYEPFQATSLPLCITEFGYLAGYGLEDQMEGVERPVLPSPYQWAESIDQAQQSVWLVNGIKLASDINSFIPIQMVMIWRINAMPLNPLLTGYAIIRSDGDCAVCRMLTLLKQ